MARWSCGGATGVCRAGWSKCRMASLQAGGSPAARGEGGSTRRNHTLQRGMHSSACFQRTFSTATAASASSKPWNSISLPTCTRLKHKVRRWVSTAGGCGLAHPWGPAASRRKQQSAQGELLQPAARTWLGLRKGNGTLPCRHKQEGGDGAKPRVRQASNRAGSRLLLLGQPCGQHEHQAAGDARSSHSAPRVPPGSGRAPPGTRPAGCQTLRGE